MKSTIRFAVAALFAAGAASLALAQAPQNPRNQAPNGGNGAALSGANVPTLTPDVNSAARGTGTPVPFVSEPVASPLGDSERAAAIAQALNSDPALKNSKITVQADGDNVLLTGASMTQGQAQLATQIANGQAGDAKVVNVIQPDMIKYKSLAELMPPSDEGAPPQAGEQASGQGNQAAQAEEEEVEPVVNQFGQPQKS